MVMLVVTGPVKMQGEQIEHYTKSTYTQHPDICLVHYFSPPK